MNPYLNTLQPYPFQKLAQLKMGAIPPPVTAINLSIGEPQHPTPDFIIQAMNATLAEGLRKYPTTQGSDLLRHSIAQWLSQRFQLPLESLDPQRHILPVNGTREALFALAQCVINPQATRPLVLIPNPFYQIYEGAALLAGAQPWFINCLEENNFQPDFTKIPADIWHHCQLLYLCSPNNPSGTVLDIATLQNLIKLADEYDFIIAADECYAELYTDEPPVGLLQACAALARWDFKRCVVFHSLSKRSNAPGLRSGFVAGDAELLGQFLLYRTYHGCSMSLVVQAASTAAWQDETHVQRNREYYRQKFTAVLDILQPVLQIRRPPAGFYLWPEVPIPDEQFTRELFIQQHVTVLPGSFLSRTTQGINPGKNRVRIALVPTLEDCQEAAHRIYTFITKW